MAHLDDMFANANTPESRGERVEALKAAMADSQARHDAGRDAFAPKHGIIRGGGSNGYGSIAALSRLAERGGELTKGLTGDEQSQMLADLDALKYMTTDLQKDITVASPGNLHPYDLEAPAKILVPRFTPLRNEIARQKGQGTAREYRRIRGYSNAGVGGVADLVPFFNSENDAFDTSFGNLSLRRGAKISYAMDVKTANYVEMSVSDLVTWKAQFSNLGFEDSRQLSQMALLWAHLLGEEKAMLYGRGATAQGYEGPVAAPTYTLGSGGTGSTFGAVAQFVRVTANTGIGQSAAGSEVTVTPSAGQNLIITLTGSQPTGAINYGVYYSTTTNTETFQGFYVPVNGTITLTTSVAGGATYPTVDTSSNANAYDGFLSVLSDPNQAGYFARFDVKYPGKNVNGNATAANNIGDTPWQDAFAALFATIYADPEDVWVSAPIRRLLTDYLRSAQNTAGAYRLTISGDPASTGIQIGGLVTGIVNESSPTSRIADLRVHPYMPLGASIIRSRVLNVPDSNIGDTSVVTSVQDYMSVDWPQIQFTYDASTYWYGTLVHYAPMWNAAIFGLQ